MDKFEALKEEIERRFDELRAADDYYLPALRDISGLRDFAKKIESTPDPTLEKEINDWVHNPLLELTEEQDRGEAIIKTDIHEFEDTARHFYELGARKDYNKLYEEIANSGWFKKAYHNKSLGDVNETDYQKGYSDGQLNTVEIAARWIEEYILGYVYLDQEYEDAPQEILLSKYAIDEFKEDMLGTKE